MTDFWEKKRQELQSQGKLPQARPEPVIGQNKAWWADEDTRVNRQPVADMQRDNTDQHDFSKANHLRDKSGSCPNCGSGNFMSTSASAAARCFDCGYVHGRQVNDLDVFALSPDARTLHVRQTDASTGLRIGKSMAEINAANARLEQSAQGKRQIDS